MDKIIDLLAYLEGKYGQPVSYHSYLIRTYGEVSGPEKTFAEYVPDESNQDAAEPEEEYLAFENDRSGNLDIIRKLTDSAVELGRDIFSVQDGEVAEKLVRHYMKELRNLAESKSLDEGERIADKYVKILKKTLIKLWGIKKISNVIREYFRQNHICIKEFEAGHKLSNEEFEMLDDNLTGALVVKTDRELDKYKVIEMIQPIVKIYFLDEDGEYDFKCVEGSCRIYM